MLARVLLPALLVAGCIYFPVPGETESESDTAPAGEVAWVAVGDAGTILRSPDGAAWTLSTSGESVALNAVTHGDGRFVAVGQAGVILTSLDGVDWEPASSPSSRDLFAVVRHGTRFFAVGGDYSGGAETLESNDGVTWTRPDLPAPKHLLRGLASDGATLAAIGFYQADLMTFGAFTWQDDAGWVQRIDPGATGTRYDTIAHGAPNFVLLGPVSAATSGDAITWNSAPTFGVAADPRALTFGPAGWIAVGGGGQILGSVGAVQWTARLSPFTTNLFGVASDAAQYIAVGDGGQIGSSVDGAAWAALSSPTSAGLRAVVRAQ